MLQQDQREDSVTAAGEQHSVREIIEVTASELDIGIEWFGTGVGEEGVNTESGEVIVSGTPLLHLPKACVTTDFRGLSADRTARAD